MSFFRKVKDSFTNFDIYREIASQKGGRTFKYLLLIFTIVFLIGGIRFAVDFSAGTGQVVNNIKDQVPEFSLANGQLTVEGPQPILIEGENGTAMIIDTTGQLDETVLDQYSEGVFVSKDHIFNKQGGQTAAISLSDFSQFNIDKQKLISYLPLMKWLLVVVAVFGYAVKLVWVLVTTVILALLGLIINSAKKGKLQFYATWNMAVYAYSLPLLLEMIKNLVYPGLPSFWALQWGIAIVILYKGIEAALKPAIPDEVPPVN